MGRRAKLERPVHVHLKLPAPLIGEVSLLLWSDAHGRVPLGKLSEFFELAIREKLARVKEVMGQRTTAILGDLNQLEEVDGS
jgi:hypothetical protein